MVYFMSMERMTLQVGSFEVNCSILSEDGKAWIVDPGQDAGLILDTLRKKGLEPAGILLTHGHFDHIGAIPELQEAFPGLPVYVHENDVKVLTHPMNSCSPFYSAIPMPKNIRRYSDLTDMPNLEVIETPGHTPGGVCLYLKPLLLSGDTLFAGSVGRTDFPGGDMSALMASLKKLSALPDDTLVIPGHGPHTTIGAEKAGNPFMQR